MLKKCCPFVYCIYVMEFDQFFFFRRTKLPLNFSNGQVRILPRVGHGFIFFQRISEDAEKNFERKKTDQRHCITPIPSQRVQDAMCCVVPGIEYIFSRCLIQLETQREPHKYGRIGVKGGNVNTNLPPPPQKKLGFPPFPTNLISEYTPL